MSVFHKETTTPSITFQDLEAHYTDTVNETGPVQQALRSSCEKILELSETSSQKFVDSQSWRSVCQVVARDLTTPLSDQEFIIWLQQYFTLKTTDQAISGKMTGYFQPQLNASRIKTDVYRYPIYRRPDDLILIEDLASFTQRAKGIRLAGRLSGGTLEPYASRQQIEEGCLEGQDLELAYVDDPIDLFFMHIQGSGHLVFEDGSRRTVSYDGTNGHDYTAIGRVLVEQGALDINTVSMQGIKTWLRDHPDHMRAVMNHNGSYVFFQEQDVVVHETIGAQNAPIIPMASVASDPHFHPLGSLLWVQTAHPTVGSRLLVAQDVGGAIKGEGRLDLFCGVGSPAGDLAGNLNESISVITLHPK